MERMRFRMAKAKADWVKAQGPNGEFGFCTRCGGTMPPLELPMNLKAVANVHGGVRRRAACTAKRLRSRLQRRVRAVAFRGHGGWVRTRWRGRSRGGGAEGGAGHDADAFVPSHETRLSNAENRGWAGSLTPAMRKTARQLERRKLRPSGA